MGRWVPFRGKKSLLFMLLLLMLTGVGWWQRTPLLAWYYVRGLAGAGDDTRPIWVQRIARLDSAAVPALLACLRRDDPRACGNAEAALISLVRQWGNRDPRALQCAEQATAGFAGLSGCGQQSALEVALMLLRAQPTPTPVWAPATQAAGRMLAAAVPMSDESVQTRALALAEVLVDAVPQGQWGDTFGAVVRAGLKSPDPNSRVRAVHLTLHAALQTDPELLTQVLPLLRDPATPVRRAALLAVGMAEKIINEDTLLPLLHDPDADVRRLCEGALRGRGLQDEQLRLARLISDARPSARLEVFDRLSHSTDLEPGAWLRRLSQDPSPAVRAAAVRAAAAQTQVDLSSRLRQMAQDDPSPTVRQLAGHYWQQQVRELGARP
jgi:HEAT repeats